MLQRYFKTWLFIKITKTLICTNYFHPRRVDIGFQDASMYQITMSYIENCLTFSEALQIKFATLKIAQKKYISGKYPTEFWTCVGDTFFCGDVFRASITVGWLVVSADVSWQLRWSQAFVGGVSLENRHHCLLDGQHKGPKWLQTTGCVCVFVCSANLYICVSICSLINEC